MFVPQTRRVFSLGSLSPPSSPDGGRSGATLRKLRSRAKYDKLESMYDFPEAIASRDALKVKVLRGSPGKSIRKPEPPAQADLVRDWLITERQRADQHAERQWKVKFLHWQKEHLATASSRQKKNGTRQSAQDDGGSGVQNSEAADEQAREEEEILALQQQSELYEKETQELQSKQTELESEVIQIREELEKEQKRRAEIEKTLQEMMDERDSWIGRSSNHDEARKRLKSEQHDAASQVVDLHQKLVSIGGVLTVEHRENALVQKRQMEDQQDPPTLKSQERAAIKIQTMHRGKLGRRRAAAKRAQQVRGQS